MYEGQTWNPVTETWRTHRGFGHTDEAEKWFDGDPNNRRILDANSRRILAQPED